jgi:hypothetical protein
MVYFAYFHSVLTYGIIFWRNSTNVHQGFKLQKRTVWVMARVGPRSSCRGMFRKLKILPLPCQYKLFLMLFVTDNLIDFPTNAYVHSLDARNKNQLCLPTVRLARVQRGVSYTGVKIFKILPSNIQSHRNKREQFKNKLHRYLITHSFYSVTEFLECKIDKDDI